MTKASALMGKSGSYTAQLAAAGEDQKIRRALLAGGDLANGFEHLTSTIQGVHLVVLSCLEGLCKVQIRNSSEPK